MTDRSLRGSRLGAASWHVEEGVIPAERQTVLFRCASCGAEHRLQFAVDAELPDQWECRSCGHQAGRVTEAGTIEAVEDAPSIGRSHWDMLLERRSVAELEELLEERLQLLRARRGERIADELLGD